MTTITPSKARSVPKPCVDAQIEFIESDEFPELEYSSEELAFVRSLVFQSTGSGRRSVDSAVGALLENSVEPLTAEEERILFRRMNYLCFQAEAVRSTLCSGRPAKRKVARINELLAEADQVCRRIVESNLRLVASIARKFSSSAGEFDECVSDGLLILLGAIRKFDYSRGFRFSTYATHSIQRHYFRRTQRQQRYSERFVLTPGEVMAEIAGVSGEPPQGAQDPARIYARLMNAADGRLNEREEAILHRRFGTGGLGVTQTLREIASEMGISKERVRQIQMAALRKLREVADEKNLLPSAG